MKKAFVAVVGLTSLSLLAACSPARPALASAPVAPVAPAASAVASGGRWCGGDVAGRWVITSSNVRIDAFELDKDCPAATATSGDVTMAGEVTYTAEGRYTQTYHFTGHLAVRIPGACVGRGLTCGDLPKAFVGPIFGAATCDAGHDGCACTLTFRDATQTATGTYTKPAAGQLAETDDGEATAELTDYCVEGAMMTQSPHPGSGSGMSGSIFLEKR